jgi:ABC-2 type transport system permease protein
MKEITQTYPLIQSLPRPVWSRWSAIFAGWWPVMRKEMTHISRDPATLFFTLIVPAIQLLMIGYAVNANVRDIATVVYDAAPSQESRRLLDRFVNSDDFDLVAYVSSEAELNQALIAGRAQVGLSIPPDYERRVLGGETASVLVLIDGSDSLVASEASNVANALALSEAAQRLNVATNGQLSLPVELRRKLLFNPDSRSPNFLLPGMIVLLLQMQTITLLGAAIVRERERATLEQMLLTPVAPFGFLLGKLLPYFGLAFTTFGFSLALLTWVFAVPMHGSWLLLLGLAALFIFALLGLAALIATRAQTQQQVVQAAIGTILPAIYLSGYLFPLSSLPPFFRALSQLLPVTHMIQIMRGVILRSAGWPELQRPALCLLAMAVTLLLASVWRFKRQPLG